MTEPLDRSLLKRMDMAAVAGVAAIALVLLLAYWQSFQMLLGYWRGPDYSHGYLVPFFSAFLLWVRRDMLRGFAWQSGREKSEMDNRGKKPGKKIPVRGVWLGFSILVFAALMYVGGEYLGFKLIKAFSLLPCFAGLALAVGGWQMFRWSWPAIFFLGFMIPLPMSIETMATVPLRRLGTIASTYILQTLGLPAVSQGNIISLSDHQIGVAEACSGLRMLMTSAALSFGLAFVIKRPIWERLIIVASAVPIALITNIVRITITGLCYEYASPQTAEAVFHDLAGWLMMPMAVGLLWLEMAILSRLTIEAAKGTDFAGALAGRPSS